MQASKKQGRLRVGVLVEAAGRGRGSSWPGTRRFMTDALQKHVGDTVLIEAPVPRFELLYRGLAKASELATGKRLDYRHSRRMARAYAKLVSSRISVESLDFLFVAGMATEAAFLDNAPPIIYTSDATLSAVKDYYAIYSDMSESAAREANSIEQSIIDKASLIVYPSDWARQSAIDDYHADPSKVHLVPYGGNVRREDVPPAEEVIGKPRSSTCRLLFIGGDWQRKGGDIAFETLLELEKRGIPSSLTVCGCVPPASCMRENVTVIPFIDKRRPDQREKFTRLLLDTDYLLLPTRNECYGMVFCEASAYGVPSITTRTGGVPGAVTDGMNGIMLPPDALASSFAEAICGIHEDEEGRLEFIRTSRAAFDERLNWDAWAKRVGELIEYTPT